MPASVHRPPLGGDLRIPATVRQFETSENRNPQKTNPEASRITHGQTDFLNHVHIRERLKLATTKTDNQVTRLQTLKQHLFRLKSKSISILGNVYKEPPDPGTAIQAELIDTGTNAAHHERDDLTSGMLREDIQVFTCSNLRNQGTSYMIHDVFITGVVIGEENPPPAQQQTKHHQNLKAKCSTNCVTATYGTHKENCMALVMEFTQPGDEGRCQAGVSHWRGGKEIAEARLEDEELRCCQKKMNEEKRRTFIPIKDNAKRHDFCL